MSASITLENQEFSYSSWRDCPTSHFAGRAYTPILTCQRLLAA